MHEQGTATADQSADVSVMREQSARPSGECIPTKPSHMCLPRWHRWACCCVCPGEIHCGKTRLLDVLLHLLEI